jgi:hypothetical protein
MVNFMTASFPKTALLDFFVVGGSVVELFCVLILEPFRILSVLQCPPGLNSRMPFGREQWFLGELALPDNRRPALPRI